MILDGEDWECAMAHAFHAIVVEINVGDFYFFRQAGGFDGEPVIV